MRIWQRRALTAYLAARPRDFLAVATPGAGKTTFALRVAAELLADHTVSAVTVVTPTEHLKTQWALAASRVGIALDPGFRNTTAMLSRDYQGIAVTYAGVAAQPALHRARTQNRRTLVILDEIHHGGDAKSWGDAVREAFAPAVRRLGLTGTPFRSDDSAIPFVRYERDTAGYLRSAADHSYGYGEALRDGVVRPVLFLAYSGQTRWRTRAGDEYAVRLGEPLTQDLIARAWRTALDPRGDWIPAVLRAADVRLSQLRSGGMPDAGGLVIAGNQKTARAYAAVLAAHTGEEPALVLSDEPGSSARITAFAASGERWLVAVRMVSEGVDIPRLAVGVYATSVHTPLFFAQAVGRFVRNRRPGETASVFLPSVPSLLGLAAEMETVRDHVLGSPDRDEGWDEAALAEANRARDEPDDQAGGFEALEASAELDQVIFDGTSWGTGAAGSEEEQDFLGLPGLLAPDQVAALLRARPVPRTEAGSVGAAPARAMHEVLAGLRKELNALVAVRHHRTGASHGAVHAELRRACGGPPTAMATGAQLEHRIATLRSW